MGITGAQTLICSLLVSSVTPFPSRLLNRVKLSGATSRPGKLSFFRHAQYQSAPRHEFFQLTATDDVEDTDAQTSEDDPASKYNMMKFAVPALGIFISSPLLSNIDNSFVGRTVGPTGLAALSPATVCTDQMLYLFSFLSRAATGMVSRAFGAEKNDMEAARQAGAAPLTAALLSGALLTLFYATCTSSLLELLQVDKVLRPAALSYVVWRGSVAWAALAQMVCLSILLATKDAVTPLRIVAMAAAINVCGDYLFCVSPWRAGCAGAAAATAVATLVSSLAMMRALWRKMLLPSLRFPSRNEWKGLLEYTGPLLAITLTRLAGFVAMQKTAMSFGVQSLAAYQLAINVMIFFLVFGEPLSQLSQTRLPGLIDAGDGAAVGATFRSILTLGLFGALTIGATAAATMRWGTGLFTNDLVVQKLASQSAPGVFAAVASVVLGVTVDGAMLASRNFGFILAIAVASFFLQIGLLRTYASSINFVLGTFAIRLLTYSGTSLLRVALGYGSLGNVLRQKRETQPMAMVKN